LAIVEENMEQRSLSYANMKKKSDSDNATDAVTLSVLIILLTFLGRFPSAGFLPHIMLEPVLKTDVCLTARDAPSTNPESTYPWTYSMSDSR